jgi:hypothetical protein
LTGNFKCVILFGRYFTGNIKCVSLFNPLFHWQY